MLPNVIILTGGISGSSVLTGLIARAGYWLGDDTKKVAYDTYENSKLVDLNMQILQQSGYFWRDVVDIPSPSIEKIGDVSKSLDISMYKEFVQQCDDHQPWLWKDPRLCYTIFFWKRMVDFRKCKFILMMRDLKQTWTGMIVRGKFAIPIDKLDIIHRDCINASYNFVKREGVQYYGLTFEDLITSPEESIDDINKFIGTHLAISDLRAIYRGPLHRTRWSKRDFFKAKLKFCYYKYGLRDIVRFPRMG